MATTVIKAQETFPVRAMGVLRALHKSTSRMRFMEVVRQCGLYNHSAATALAWLVRRELAVRIVVREILPQQVEYEITSKGRALVAALEPVEEWRREWD